MLRMPASGCEGAEVLETMAWADPLRRATRAGSNGARARFASPARVIRPEGLNALAESSSGGLYYFETGGALREIIVKAKVIPNPLVRMSRRSHGIGRG